MMNENLSPGLCEVVMLYSVAIYDQLNRLTIGQSKEVVDAALEIGLFNPLLMRNKHGKFDEFELPHLGKKSSVYVVAVQAAYLIWNQRHMKNAYVPNSPLLRAADDGFRFWKMQQRPQSDDRAK